MLLFCVALSSQKVPVTRLQTRVIFKKSMCFKDVEDVVWEVLEPVTAS